MADVRIPDCPIPPIVESPSKDAWSRQRAQHQIGEKRLMAEFYALHDFLVPANANPALDPREPFASILVTQGTTPNVVVEAALKWIEQNQHLGSFGIIWYTPGALVPGTLLDFRLRNPALRAAAQLFLFPGRVNFETEAVSGPEALAFAEQLDRCFTYAFLGANSFDIESGTAYFAYSEEITLQRAYATLYAAHKFLFLDASKFKSNGNPGYNVRDLLETSEMITIYTVSSDKDEWIKSEFDILQRKVLRKKEKRHTAIQASYENKFNMKSLRLRIVGKDNKPSELVEHKGFLKEPSA